MYNWVTFLCSRNEHNSLNQLYFNKKIKIKNKIVFQSHSHPWFWASASSEFIQFINHLATPLKKSRILLESFLLKGTTFTNTWESINGYSFFSCPLWNNPPGFIGFTRGWALKANAPSPSWETMGEIKAIFFLLSLNPCNIHKPDWSLMKTFMAESGKFRITIVMNLNSLRKKVLDTLDFTRTVVTTLVPQVLFSLRLSVHNSLPWENCTPFQRKGPILWPFCLLSPCLVVLSAS